MSKRRQPEFSELIKAKAYARANGKCEGCGFLLKKNNRHYDHIKPMEMGGKSELGNCQLLCTSCHTKKTGEEDIPAIAKSNRAMKAHAGLTRRKSRPIPGSIASGIRKKLNGTVEFRVTGNAHD